MITYLAKGVNFLTLILQNIIIFTSSIGYVIVLLITTIVTAVYNVIKYILLFFQIIYEDNVTIFTDDLPNLIGNIYDAVLQQWTNTNDIVSKLTNEILLEVTTIISNIKLSLSTIFSIVREVVQILIRAIVLIGDASWLLLTFVPVHLPYLITEFFKYIRERIICYVIDAYMALLEVTNFLTEVPLQSFMGIITAIILTRSCIHFREAIHSHVVEWYWILVRKITYIYYMIYNYFTNSEVRTITRLIAGEPLAVRDNDVDFPLDDNDDAANHGDALCVICQERQKCVLTLPCRHVCLCTECCMRLYGYQRTCPICRTFIYHSVNVYL